jgi:flagellar basal-body rod protein FlgB
MPEISPLFPARQAEIIGNAALGASDTGEEKSSAAFSSILENAISRSAAANVASSGNLDSTGKLALGTTHSFHLPANEKRLRQENGDFQQTMLGIRAYRQQILASNIANADTLATKRWILILLRPLVATISSSSIERLLARAFEGQFFLAVATR